MMQKHLIKTFGCQMNIYDAARMSDLLKAQCGTAPTEDPTQADLIIFNTCHVREKAEEKLFSELGRFKKSCGNRKVVFAVGGCVGQAEGMHIFRRAPYVDIVFGPQNYHHLPALLARVASGETRIHDDTIPADEKFDALPEHRVSGAIGSVTVQEGCDKFCAFCVVPYTRGREWSRSVDEIVRECQSLVEQGARELLLMGQNVNAYNGLDAGHMAHDLPMLLHEVAMQTEVERIRFVTSHPLDMSDDLIDAFAEIPQLCPYLHLPIQSGSDRVLQRMGRGHDAASYLDWVEKFRKAAPNGAMASDFIVGFPGESEADFQATLDLVDVVRFDHAYSFKYSPRPGTPALEMEDNLSEEVRKARLATLQARLNLHQLERNRALVGSIAKVLVEGKARAGQGVVSGRTSCNRSVHFAGGDDLIGQIVPVRITEGLPNSLRGEEAL
ncbi:MAG: tRNA (N6-isopentenyl adenosine(37)-C2)-methylthiotransferase MiaB [Magnetococcales bacterium]|nr:tRNA (N6-isopentenyl adenosine(37)-C2)-methylthiotransferase MiaB [Magnetococcales bacterium]